MSPFVCMSVCLFKVDIIKVLGCPMLFKLRPRTEQKSLISHNSYRVTILDGNSLLLTWIWNILPTYLGSPGSYTFAAQVCRN